MKSKNTPSKLFISVFLCTSIIHSNIISVNALGVNTINKHLTSSKYSTVSTSINTYAQFYTALKNAINSQKSTLTLKINNYKATTYNLSKALSKLEDECFNLKHYVNSSQASISGIKTSSSKTMTIYLSYKSANATASTTSTLISLITSAAKSKKSSIIIKTKNIKTLINDTIVNQVNERLPSHIRISKLYSQSSSYPGSNINFTKYTIEYDINDSANIPNDELTINESINVINNNINTTDDLYKSLKNSIEKYDSTLELNIKDTKLRESVLNSVTTVLESNPDIAYVNNWRTSTMGNSVTITFNYNFTKDKLTKMKNELDIKSKKIISSIINPSMTYLEKEKAIHDYIVNNTKYDEDGLNSGSIPQESFTDYGALVKGVAVCEGYAKAMYKLCKMANIPCIVISGTANNSSGSIGHAWNIVKLNNKYYHVDTTWDDPIFYYNGVKKDTLKYDYFNISDSKISKDHKWDKSKYPTCN